MEWFRLYDDLLDDPKAQQLSPELFKHWINLLCLSNKGTPRGVLPCVKDIAFRLRLPLKKADELVDTFIRRGFLDYEPETETLQPHNWTGRQRVTDDVAERQRKHRAMVTRNDNVTPVSRDKPVTGNDPVTLPVTPMSLSRATEQIQNRTDTDTEQINTPPTSSKQSKKIDLKGFDDFYGPYPKHQKRAEAEVAWAKLKPDERQSAIEAIQRQVLWPQMTGDQQFIPLPGSWLGARRWEDEPPQITATGRSPNGTIRRTGGAAHGGMTLQEQAEYTAELEREEREQIRNVENPVKSQS